jgi:hypothetical protein
MLLALLCWRNGVTCPTNTRNEERSPVRGSELNSKAATLQGGGQQKSCPSFVYVGLGPVVIRARV